MKTTSLKIEQKPHNKLPKKKKSLWDLAKETPVPEGLSGLINILAPYELPKNSNNK